MLNQVWYWMEGVAAGGILRSYSRGYRDGCKAAERARHDEHYTQGFMDAVRDDQRRQEADRRSVDAAQ